MKLLRLTLWLLFLLTSCKRGEIKKCLIINGNIKNSFIKKVYFTDASNWQVLLDSSKVINEKFHFEIPKSKLEGDKGSIYYFDEKGSQEYLPLVNRVLSPDSIKYLLNAFLIDSNIVTITGDLAKSEYFEINAGMENRAYYRTQMMQFGYLDAEPVKRTAQLNEYLNIVKEYPYSQFLLSQIDENKSVLKKAELTLMLQGFTAKALQSDVGKKLIAYSANKIDTPTFENLVLEDNNAKPVKIIDTTARLNMVIIWASWCGPCRQEIPEVKKLYNQYSTKGLTITNISIDDAKNAWQDALNVEKMPWKQLIVPEEKKQVFNTKFEVGSIPYMLFLDNKGKLISRSIGVGKNSFDEYKRIIAGYIK